MKYTTPDYELEIVETEDILELSLLKAEDGYNVRHDPKEDYIEVDVPDISILL